MKYNYKKYVDVRESGREFPGSFRIDSVILENAKGNHDISDIISQIVVYESLDMPFIIGEIHIQDPFNTILNSRIMGNETLKFTIKDGNARTSLEYSCYKIGERIKVSPTREDFKLHFMSKPAFVSQYKKISKAYTNMKGEDIIKDMFFFATGEELKEDKFYYDKSLNDICCVIPNWDLVRGCTFIAGRTISPHEDLQSNTYCFWETIDGIFNFFPYEGLIDNKRNQVFGDFYYDPLRRKGSTDGSERTETVSFDASSRNRILSLEELQIVSGIDYLNHINSGMFANKTSVIDLTQREVDNKDFDYVQDFGIDGSKHLKGIDGETDSFPLVHYGSPIVKDPHNAWFPIIKSKGLFTQEKDSHRWYNDTSHKRFSKAEQLENFVILGKLPGHLGLQAGMIINLVIPSGGNPIFNNGKNSELDRYMSGEYLVKGVTRRFTTKNFEMTIEIVKDGINQHLTY